MYGFRQLPKSDAQSGHLIETGDLTPIPELRDTGCLLLKIQEAKINGRPRNAGPVFDQLERKLHSRLPLEFGSQNFVAENDSVKSVPKPGRVQRALNLELQLSGTWPPIPQGRPQLSLLWRHGVSR